MLHQNPKIWRLLSKKPQFLTGVFVARVSDDRLALNAVFFFHVVDNELVVGR